MADPGVYAFSIRKSMNWRGKTQGFSNLYHYNVESPTEALLLAFIDALKAAEVPVHSTNVTFVEGRSWGPVQSNGRGGRMEAVKALSGTGSASPSTTMYREAAYLVYWALGRYGSKNRPQFIRKWLHCNTLFTLSGNFQDGNTAHGGAPAPITTYIAAVRSVTPVGGGATYDLMTASQHVPISSGQLYTYLEHHQFGR